MDLVRAGGVRLFLYRDLDLDFIYYEGVDSCGEVVETSSQAMARDQAAIAFAARLVDEQRITPPPFWDRATPNLGESLAGCGQ